MNYKGRLTISTNKKGVVDIDTVKGCSFGMSKYPNGGCYGVCYANRMAICRGFDFSKSISRQPYDDDVKFIETQLRNHNASWFRIGTMGDPSHDWPLTLYVTEWLSKIKTPVIVTKHWIEMPAAMLERFKKAGAIFNTSISALDTEDEIDYRLGQYYRLSKHKIKSVLRIVTANFGGTEQGRYLSLIQNNLFMYTPFIDNPIRIARTDERVVNGTIKVTREDDLGGGSTVSIFREKAYIGHCVSCPDQCGINL